MAGVPPLLLLAPLEDPPLDVPPLEELEPPDDEAPLDDEAPDDEALPLDELRPPEELLADPPPLEDALPPPKRATSLRSRSIFSDSGFDAPEAASLHPRNEAPLAGVEVTFTTVPAS